MLRSLFPRIDWSSIRAIGFDMDGTLYDEAEFIAQVYQPIAKHISGRCAIEPSIIHDCLLRRWLEKGSSYDKLFSDVLSMNGIPDSSADQLVSECVQIFRSFKPRLRLPARTRAILDHACQHYSLFLVTDGSGPLQRAKFDSLCLGAWFSNHNVCISGEHGHAYQKPAVHITQKIQVLSSPAPRNQTVFFGDREIDRRFAAAAGFQFIAVNVLFPTHD